MQQLDAENLIAEARRRTGLHDLGDDEFRPALTRLVDDIARGGHVGEDRIEALGERFLRLLMNRLWFAKDLHDHPEILDEPIVAPVEIVSLPRTGSTKLHRLLAASGDFQFAPMWKTHMFARIPGLADGGEAERIATVREYEAWMLEASPLIRTGHPMFTDEAEEDQWLAECVFRRPMNAMLFDVPNFAQWLMRQDPTSGYEYFRSQIQYLQWQNRQLRGAAEAAKPWLLKSPDHFGAESFLRKVFGDVRLVITHRQVVECLASAAPMTHTFRALYAPSEKVAQVSEQIVQMVAMMARSHLQWRAADTGASVLDVSFRQITREGLAAARKVYDFLGMAWTPSAERGMQAWETANERNKHGRNVYSIDDLGVTPDQAQAAFGDYVARYAEYF